MTSLETLLLMLRNRHALGRSLTSPSPSLRRHIGVRIYVLYHWHLIPNGKMCGSLEPQILVVLHKEEEIFA